MGRTIIQPIGPLYGEAVNGTVFGRPNGSVYVPETNQISLSLDSLYVRNWTNHGVSPYQIYVCSSGGSSLGSLYHHIVAKSQDIAAYVVLQICASSDFDSDIAYRVYTAGNFNITDARIADKNLIAITSGESYYVRAVLMASSGVPVAYSSVIEVTGKS